MLFNSLNYIAFLLIVYTTYRLLPFRQQNVFLLLASYTFYGFWDVRFLFLITLSTVIDFCCGQLIYNGNLSKNVRIKSSIFLITTAFAFLVVQWPSIDLTTQSLQETIRVSLSSKLGWNIFIFILFLVIGLNILYTFLDGKPALLKRRLFLICSIVANLSILGFFKYFNFFIDSLEELLRTIQINPTAFRLDIILPVGISFYTFQTMSYTIDIYRQSLKPTPRFLDFALFVAYFPQLVAGPIERAVNLIPKIVSKRTITLEQTLRGLHLIVYGLFKKVVIADGVARTVNLIYGSTGQVSWLELMVGTLLFALQIYCDFSGYSDIARGTSKLFGIDIMINFKFPYFSKNPQEFWSRWHISLSSWLRDYLYIPLGGNRFGELKTYRNLLITMLLGGLWHGAAWNFVLWGGYHGIVLSIHRKFSAVMKTRGHNGNKWTFDAIKLMCFFLVTLYGWMLFRATSFEQIISFTWICFGDFGNLSFNVPLPRASAVFGLPLFILFEVYGYLKGEKTLYKLLPVPVWTSTYSYILFCLFMGMSNESAEFIYFQF